MWTVCHLAGRVYEFEAYMYPHVSNSTVFEASMSSFFAGYIPRSLWPGIVLTEEAQLQKMTHNI